MPLSYFRRRRFGSKWGNQFTREPLGVYQEKERERTVSLVQGAMAQQYGDSSKLPPTLGVGTRKILSWFDEQDRKQLLLRSMKRTATTPQPEDDGPGGILGFAKDVGSTAMKVADVGFQQVGAPLAGILTGSLAYERKQVGEDEQGNPVYERRAPRGTKFGPFDLPTGRQLSTIGRGIVKGVTNPSGAGEAFQEFQATGSPGAQIATRGALDPTMWAGPGALKGIIPGNTLAARAARGLVEQPKLVSAGAIAGSAAAGQYGEHVPLLNKLPEELRPLAGGVIGAASPGLAARASRGVRNLPQSIGEESPVASVSQRRERNAGRSGNTITRMNAAEIGEIVGAPDDDLALARRVIEARKAGAEIPPQVAQRVEANRQRWTEEYSRRNDGRQPVWPHRPGARGEKYRSIDEFFAANPDLEPTSASPRDIDRAYKSGRGSLLSPDLGGEQQGRTIDYFGERQAAGETPYQRVMRFEKIASDPSNKPEIRQQARRRIFETTGAVWEEPDVEGAAGIVERRGGLASRVAGAQFGRTPLQLAARAGAGFASAELEGEDTEDSLTRALLVALPGTVARTALKSSRNMDEVLRAVADDDTANIDGQEVSVALPIENVKHEDIKVYPSRFQNRPVPEGLYYDPARVSQLQAEWDPNQLEPGIVVRHTGETIEPVAAADQRIQAGDLVVIGAHHRLELMRRQARAGKFSGEAPWRVVDADLNNPGEMKRLEDLAELTNRGVRATGLKEDIAAYRRFAGDDPTPESVASARDRMAMKDSQISDLVYLSQLPDDVIDRLSAMSKTSQEGAAEIARIAAEYGLPGKDIRSALGRFVFDQEKAATRGAIRRQMTRAAEDWKASAADRMQGSLFGDEFDTILRRVDELEALDKRQAEIEAVRNRSIKEIERLEKAATDEERGTLATARQIAEREYEAAIASLNEQRQGTARITSTEPKAPEALPGEPVRPEPVQAGPGLFDDQLGPEATPAPAGIATPRGVVEPTPIDPFQQAGFEQYGTEVFDPNRPMNPPAEPPPPGRFTSGMADEPAPEGGLPFEERRLMRIEPLPAPEFGVQRVENPTGATGRDFEAPRQETFRAELAPGERGGADESGVDAALAERVETAWNEFAERTGIFRLISAREQAARESGGLAKKIIVDWPTAASRAIFTANTSGDPGTGMIQGIYFAFTNPREWAKTMRDSYRAMFDPAFREAQRTFGEDMVRAVAPPSQRDTLPQMLRDAQLRITKRADDLENMGDVGSLPLESRKLGPVGAYFRGTRRQFEVFTERLRWKAAAEQVELQSRHNVVAGIGPELTPAQIADIAAIANHLTGATSRVTLGPYGGVLFGAPRFFMAQLALMGDMVRRSPTEAIEVGGRPTQVRSVAMNYARKRVARTIGMVAGGTILTNIATSKGEDVFGPGLGWDAMEDPLALLTHPNFMKVRIKGADISAFGPLEPLAKAFFSELATLGQDAAVLGGLSDEEFKAPGEGVRRLLTGKFGPLARTVYEVAQGGNEFTGQTYDNFWDYAEQNWDAVLPIFAQNSREAIEGTGSWADVVAGYFGLRSAPTTTYERMIGTLAQLDEKYWVEDAETELPRPPKRLGELTKEQQATLRKEEPTVERYLAGLESDEDRPMAIKLREYSAAAQLAPDREYQENRLTADKWRQAFVEGNKRVRDMRGAIDPDYEARPATTVLGKDLETYFGIWDDPRVKTPEGQNYEVADQLVAELMESLGGREGKRWTDLKNTLGWNESPVVREYLRDMDIYGNKLRSIPKYAGVPVDMTRRVDRMAGRVRQLQAKYKGLPGKDALWILVDQGEFTVEDANMARAAISQKYSPEWDDFKNSDEGRRVTKWFRPELLEEPIKLDNYQPPVNVSSSRRGGSRRRASRRTSRRAG